jgi:ABC-type transport system involved in cytochrome c biogenesis permease subunit
MLFVAPHVGLPSRLFNPLVRFFSSIWLGITLLALILSYSSIISAYAPARWALEMTEMQAFRHWFFVTLAGLFLIALLVTTLFRSRWIPLNAGAVVAHIGLLTLGSGAFVYFATKTEGNVLLQAPAIHVRATMGGQSGILDQFRAAPGETWTRALPRLAGPLGVTVVKTQAVGSEPVGTATVEVRVGDGAPATYTLASTPNVWTAVAEGLELGLQTYPAQRYFYDDDRPALYIHNLGAATEDIREIHGLPIYYEHYLADAGTLHDTQGVAVPPRRERPELNLLGLKLPTGWFEPWRMPIDVDSAGLPFTMRITGYAPFVVNLRPATGADGVVRMEPIVATREQRRPDISARSMSAIRLEFKGRDANAGWSDTQWCLFSLYADVEARPLEVKVPGVTMPWEITYSRVRHNLGAVIAASRLGVDFFPGQRGIKGYNSDIVIQTPTAAPYAATVQTNHTVTVGPWTLFQSGFAEDRWSYSVLGVGNRNGMLPMIVGWITVAIGCLYAFYVKPVLLRRARRLATGIAPLLAVGLLTCISGCRKQAPYDASRQAAALDGQLNWSRARLIAVQEGGRYKTLDSFARESFSDITGKENLPGLSPLASLFEWLFNPDAYIDTPLIKVRSPDLRARLAAPLTAEKRERIDARPYFTLREIFTPELEKVLAQLESDPKKRSAVNRVRNAEALAQRLGEFLAIVPQPGGVAVAEWFAPQQVLANLSDAQLRQMGITRADLPMESRRPVPGIAPDQALDVVASWTSLRAAWLQGDAGRTQRYLDQLTDVLPTLAAAGVYPKTQQREAEARYYAAGKFTYGWALYFLALLVSILALVTGWRTPWLITIVLTLGALAVHFYGISLRWYILGRIPVANMFEAVVASTAIGIAVALLIEVFQRTRVLLVGAAAAGFFGLVGAQYVLPGAALSTIPAILDDIQLRLHTVMIITAYALIFVAAVIAVIYLVGYYKVKFSRMAYAAPAVALAGGPTEQRPILAGGTPDDVVGAAELPAWLNNIDWSHLIVLNMIFVLLFVGGVVLGAWWADYSWGRPWGWDPKEVFALNTWIVYAILLHTRFVVRNRGLWTAWLSIAGCIMMGFNWFFVNFFIASVHSYA